MLIVRFLCVAIRLFSLFDIVMKAEWFESGGLDKSLL